MGGSYPDGNIQVLDDNYNLIYDSSYLEIESVIDFCFSDSKVFVIYINQNDIGILEFNYINGIPYYIDYYNNFPDEILSITDVDLFGDYIYISTDKGVFGANFYEHNLKLSTSWEKPSYGIDDSDVIFFHKTQYH